MDSCIYDRYVQCFRDCPKCPRAIKGEPDPDELFEMVRDDAYDFKAAKP